MDNEISKAGYNGENSRTNQGTGSRSMQDQRSGNIGRACIKRPHTPAGIGTTASIGKQACAIYQRVYIEKAVDGV